MYREFNNTFLSLTITISPAINNCQFKAKLCFSFFESYQETSTRVVGECFMPLSLSSKFFLETRKRVTAVSKITRGIYLVSHEF